MLLLSNRRWGGEIRMIENISHINTKIQIEFFRQLEFPQH
jgi:hypothetical protein